MKRQCGILILASSCAVLAWAKPAHGYLGGFENADGYSYTNTFPQLDNWVDVTAYNAGNFGANAGNGTPAQIVVNSGAGLWSYSSPNGCFFDTPANRVTYMGAAPTFNSSAVAAPNTVGNYVIGAHFGGRTANGLAVRNVTSLGPIEYDYKLDSFDTGGPAPASIVSGAVTTGFFFLPNPSDSITDPSGAPADKFIMSFKDTSGSIGFQWGYLRDNSVVWRPGSSGPWVATGIIADTLGYDGVTAQIDLTAQTFGIRYYDLSLNLNIPIAPLGTPLGAPMADYTHIGWWLTDQLTSGSLGGKNMFDDFSITTPIPEPASLLILAAGAALAGLRRRAV